MSFDLPEGMTMEQLQELMSQMGMVDKTEHLKTLTPKTLRRVQALVNIHKERVALEEQYLAELHELKLKYEKMSVPLYDRRTKFITGEAEPTDEEATGFDPAKANPEVKEDESVVGIPNFWYHALTNNDTVRMATGINEKDKEALSYLTDIRCETLSREKKPLNDDAKDLELKEGEEKEEEEIVTKSAFKLIFYFKENPFFKEKVIEKTYSLIEDDVFGEPMFENVSCTPITWNEGKDLTVQTISKKVGGKKGKNGKKTPVRTITTTEPCPSFFSFFKTPEVPSPDAEEEEIEEYSTSVREDYEAGRAVRDNVCTAAVMWFTGAADEDDDEDAGGLEFDDDEDDEDDYDDEDDEDEDEDDEDDEDEDADDEEDNKNDNKNAPAENPECKQQ